MSDENASLSAAALLGVGVMAAVDEIVFHQLLAWHHFYDRSTLAVGLFADGLLHAGELVVLAAGGLWIANLLRRRALARSFAWAGFFLGLGGFQVVDGILFHKVLHLHQIRYVVPLWPYDLAWNLFGVVLLGIGATLLARARRSTATKPGRGAGARAPA